MTLLDTMSSTVINNNAVAGTEKKSLRKSFSMGAPKKGMKGMIKRGLSFSLKKSMSKRSLTPMKQRRDSNATESLTSIGSTADFLPMVRFETASSRSKKVKVQVHEFERHSEEDAEHIWYTEADMLEIIEDVKQTVRHYHKNCERYKFAMDKISQKCASASANDDDSDNDCITAQFDARVLEQLSNAAARGLEHHIAPRVNDTRKEIIQQVVQAQDDLYYNPKLSKEQKEEQLAAQYSRLARTAARLAKTMGDGDAMVASTVAAVSA
ncbi:expressed unknown protein [Seminavis robusta]|uniref:Uncharacterized protein n=1 Tax=Seminavis robusta TaxID=568900 RepID=A0A9N8EA76_9STRA|nr:expressed unknown protein [Seminavis robusta]|eukprot:Sro796_g203810.1 n/a (267) ;mRNA; f:43094-43894